MIVCTICNDGYCGINHSSPYATPCGHIFHLPCIIKWMESSTSCPNCRSTISIDGLIRLFLQVDPNARILWDQKTDEEIKSLKEKIISIKKNDTLYISLKTQIDSGKRDLDVCRDSIIVCKKQTENERKKYSELAFSRKLLDEQYNASEVVNFDLQEENLLLKSKIKLQNQELYNLQSSNTSTIDQLKFEIADLKSEKAYYQRCNIKNINIEQPSTSKDLAESSSKSFEIEILPEDEEKI